MSVEYWYVVYILDRSAAEKVFLKYAVRSRPVLLFECELEEGWLVAGYGVDEEHLAATEGIEVEESYAGWERVAESLVYHRLIATANFVPPQYLKVRYVKFNQLGREQTVEVDFIISVAGDYKVENTTLTLENGVVVAWRGEEIVTICVEGSTTVVASYEQAALS